MEQPPGIGKPVPGFSEEDDTSMYPRPQTQYPTPPPGQWPGWLGVSPGGAGPMAGGSPEVQRPFPQSPLLAGANAGPSASPAIAPPQDTAPNPMAMAGAMPQGGGGMPPQARALIQQLLQGRGAMPPGMA